MKFKHVHTNLNVLNLEKSLEFYKKALGLELVREMKADDGSFILAFISDGTDSNQIELTWMRDRKDPYDLGDNEIHLAFVADDYDAAYALHKEMGCICYENTSMGLYFIEDPDGYWLEVLPAK
ncbi:MAG: VOC family protein [Oscillospiraceae bacterium]|nr:VOC family protein [Oscillospiraceae bacterium]